jgi:hypothetical protein
VNAQEAVDKISNALQVLDVLGENSHAYHAQRALSDLRIYTLRLEGHNAAQQERIEKAARALGATL